MNLFEIEETETAENEWADAAELLRSSSKFPTRMSETDQLAWTAYDHLGQM